MSEPGRLFDESDDELERLLIGAARSEKSSPRARARTLAALGITGSAALAATAASASAATAAPVAALGKVTWAKLVLGLSALGTVAAVPPAYRAWQRHHLAGAAITAAAPVRPAAQVPPEAPGAPGPTATASAAPSTTDTMSVGTAKIDGVDGIAGIDGSTPSAAILSRELGALDAARALLARGQPGRALARLDAYATSYPQGRLGLEAEILRIDALSRAGRRDQARLRAGAFLRDHPHSLLAARARQYLRD